MTIRSLQNEVKRLASDGSVSRCPCGAILPPELLTPRPLELDEGRKLPELLQALLAVATLAEKQELQDVLNRCLDLHPDVAKRECRFTFAVPHPSGPCCPVCGRTVDNGQLIVRVTVVIPLPDEFLDALARDPRFVELEATMRQRAG